MKKFRFVLPVVMLISTIFITNKSIAQNGNCDFPDCPSGELYDAVQYLCGNGIVEGIDDHLYPNENITRDQLAKITLYGLYGGINNVPTQLVTDSFPSIYPDLQDPEAYYYRSAKALLYLEYGDGISPFDRDRAFFDPEAPIERCYVLKVLLEAFNVVPEPACMENPFLDFDPDNESYGKFWGYANKAYTLNIVNTETFRPGDNCTRGEAFLFLYRMMTSELITIPVPTNTNDFENSDFFIPINLRPKVISEARGIEQGNFSYYDKDLIHIPGYIPLDFSVGYDSYYTEIPQGYLPCKPLGPSWTHSYNIYLSMACDAENNQRIYVVHMGDGTLLMYEPEPFINLVVECASITEGNYNKLKRMSDNKFQLETTDHYIYELESISTNASLFYLTKIREDNYPANKVELEYEYVSPTSLMLTNVSAFGRSLNLSYTAGKLSSVTDPIGRQIAFSYNDNGYLASIQDAKGNVTSFQYGTTDADDGLITCIELPRGNMIHNDYQQRKLRSTRVNDEPPTTIDLSFDYDEGNSSSTLMQPLNRTSLNTQYGFNLDNRITHITNHVDKDISYSYEDSNDGSLVTSVIDNITGTQTNYSYTNAGSVASIEIPTLDMGHVFQQYVYNGNGTLASMTDFNGNTTSFDYLGWKVTSVVDALGNTTNISYNDHGAPETITGPMGKVTQYEYNQYGNLTRFTENPLGITSITNYDAISRVESTTNSSGKTRHYEYDNNCNVTKVIDELGNSTAYFYDENDNLIRIVNSKGYATELIYDLGDLLESVSFQGSAISMEYNPDGTIKKYTSPKGDVFNYVYDEAGRLTSDGYASYSYNDFGLVESVTKDGKSIVYEYQAIGLKTKSITYDGIKVNYSYDLNGNVKTITYPGDGDKTVTYYYDALNRVESVTDWNNNTTSFVYRSDGQLDYYTYPNEVRTYYTYDENGRQNGVSSYRSNGLGSLIASESFSLDNIGNIIQEDVVQPFETLPSEIASYLSYTYNSANRLETMGDISFMYDANGNTTMRTGREYSYDSKDNLIGVLGGFTATYTYDGLGNRRTATRDGETTNYVLDILTGNGNVIMETDGGGSPIYYYVYGPYGLISRIDANNEVEYYVYDYRGSTLAMVDATTDAAITHKYQYDDFGNVTQSEETDLNRFRFVGRNGVMFETDDLAFMRARYYDCTIGRFLSEDPIWSPNLYVYADNNPINYYDPYGTMSIGILSKTISISTLGLESIQQNTTGGTDFLSKVVSVADKYSTGCFLVGALSKYIPSLQGISAFVNGTASGFISTSTINITSSVSGTFHALATAGGSSWAGAVPIVGWCISAFCFGWSIGTIIGNVYGDEITQWLADGMIKRQYNAKKREYEKSRTGIKTFELQGRGANMPLQHSVSKSEWEDVFIPRCGY